MTTPTLDDLPPRARARLTELATSTIHLKEIVPILREESIWIETEVVLALAGEIRGRAREAERARAKVPARRRLNAGGKHVHADLSDPAFRRRGLAGGNS
jgi:hypothetical protein